MSFGQLGVLVIISRPVGFNMDTKSFGLAGIWSWCLPLFGL